MNDVELYEAGYNRVYDTLEPEQNLDHVELVMEEYWQVGPPADHVFMEAEPCHRRTPEAPRQRRGNLEIGV